MIDPLTGIHEPMVILPIGMVINPIEKDELIMAIDDVKLGVLSVFAYQLEADKRIEND